MNAFRPRRALASAVLAVAALVAGCQHPPNPAAPEPSSAAQPAHLAPVAAPDRIVPMRRKTGRPAGEALAQFLQGAGRTVEVAGVVAQLRAVQEKEVTLEESIAVVARRHDLWVHAQYGTPYLLKERLKAGVPVLVQFAPPSDGEEGTFAVVTAFYTNRSVYRVLNARGQAVDQEETFFQRDWAPTRYWMMTACRPERGRWSLTTLEHMSRMQYLDATGQRARADADAAQALLKNGRSPEVCVALGVRERLQGRAAEAETLWRRALAADPSHVRAANNLAFLLAEQRRNLDEAEALARGAARIEPTNPRILHTVGYVLQARQREDEALTWFENAFARSVTEAASVRSEIGLQLAGVYRDLNRLDDAARVVRRLRKENPGLLLPVEWNELAR